MLAILVVHAAILISGFLVFVILFRRRPGLALIVLFLLTPAVLFGWYQATRLDVVASCLYPSDTVYSVNFSPSRFGIVSEGMRLREVVDLLGQPLEKRTDAGRQEYWYYSRHGKQSQNYWNYIVIADPVKDEVIGRFREFYTD